MIVADHTLVNSNSAFSSGGKSSAFSNARERFAAGRMGMWLFLASLAMLFIASLVGYVIIRVQLKSWPHNLPPLPMVLLASTGLLIISSITLQTALNHVRSDQPKRVGRLMVLTALLALGFLIMQSVAWSNWYALVGEQWENSQPFRWALASFYVLTGIHALHVLGGIGPMLIATTRALRGEYRRDDHAGLHYCAMYWHFLGLVWIVLYGTLLIGT